MITAAASKLIVADERAWRDRGGWSGDEKSNEKMVELLERIADKDLSAAATTSTVAPS